MKSLPTLLALLAICATSVAVTAKTVPGPKISRSDLRNKLRITPTPISIDDLEPGVKIGERIERLPDLKAISKLNGKQVQMIGQIYPWYENGQPVKLYFSGDSCHGPYLFPKTPEDAPLLLIPITFRERTTVIFRPAPVEIEGRLIIEPRWNEGVLTHTYRIEDATIRPAEHDEGFGPSLMYLGC